MTHDNMHRIWLKQYPEGAPHEIELDPEESLIDLFDEACATYPSQPAFTNLGRTISYGELNDYVARFAAYLQAQPGLERGDRVAIMMPNLLQYPVALFGLLKAGMIAVNINPLYTSRELKHQLNDSGAKAIVIAANSGATLSKVIADTDIRSLVITEIGDLLGFPRRLLVNFAVRYIKRLIKAYDLPDAVPMVEALKTPRSTLKVVNSRADDLAVLQYTGGTTGRAKGAALTHGNLVANLRQINSWFSSVAEAGNEIVITALPLYHVYALTCNCLCYLALGARNILITDPRDTRGLIAELKKWPFTAITGVNTLYQSLINHPSLPEVDFSTLKITSAGGMAVMQDTAEQWFMITGKPVIEGYGLSETSPVLTSNILGRSIVGSIGLPLPSTDISLRDENNSDVPLGEAGELCARGPQVMCGYWRNEEATAKAMTPDGYFKTGDIATMDAEGFLRIVDRKKDMILVSGFNVYPNEVENVVTMHPAVIEAACIGVPAGQGEAVKVFVVVKPDSGVTAKDIEVHCRENLAAYKVPDFIEFRDELPKSNVGKILRRELRDG